jgi:hypothetical protein
MNGGRVSSTVDLRRAGRRNTPLSPIDVMAHDSQPSEYAGVPSPMSQRGLATEAHEQAMERRRSALERRWSAVERQGRTLETAGPPMYECVRAVEAYMMTTDHDCKRWQATKSDGEQ